MKVYLLPSDGTKRRTCTLPFPEADHCIPAGDCPACGSANFGAQGAGRRPSRDDLAWEADARATCCGAYVGTLRVETNTLFGVREDEAVLRGRCRVY